MAQELLVDLSRPPQDRWRLNPAQMQQAHELLRVYRADLGLQEDVAGFLTGAAEELVYPEHWAEMEAFYGSMIRKYG